MNEYNAKNIFTEKINGSWKWISWDYKKGNVVHGIECCPYCGKCCGKCLVKKDESKNKKR